MKQSSWCPSLGRYLFIKIGVENPHLGDALNRQLVATRAAANRLGRRPVIDAKRLPLVRAHVRVHPSDLVRGIALNNGQTSPGTVLVDGDQQPVWKLSLDDVAWHRDIP